MTPPGNVDQWTMATRPQFDQASIRITAPVSRAPLGPLLRRPPVLVYAVVTAYRTWLVALLLAAVIVAAVKPAVEVGVRQVLPPVRQSKMLGLVKREKPRPAALAVTRLLMLAAWAGVGGVVFLRWRRELPDRLAAAEACARRWEHEAERLAETAPDRSRRLYRAALVLTLDREARRRVQARLCAPGGAADAAATCAATPADTLAPPTRAGAEGPAPPGLDRRYRLEEKLGQGAMGIVYRGHDQVLDRPVALKRLAARLVGESVYSERFRQEARALARLSHPHIVQVFDLIAVGKEIWMVLEYLDGGSLADYLKTHGRLEPAEAARMICGIADGLAVAHREGIIHRDIKPANILLTADRRAKLSDFGIAKLAREATLTQAGSTLGSPAYMSPEQCSGEGLDERSDIYSLGITLYELLAGRPPFAGETSGILAQHLVGDPAPLAQWAPGVPEPLDRLVRLMLAKRREDRPQMMAEVAAALDGWTERTAPVPGA